MTYRDFLVRTGDGCAVINLVHIVGEESIAAILRDDAKRDEESQAISVASSPEKICIAAGLLKLELEKKSFPNLLILKANSWIIFVSISMVVGEDCFGIFISFLGHKPTRALWNP